MKLLIPAILSIAFAGPAIAQSGSGAPKSGSSLALDDIRSVSPALGRYAQEDLLGGLWARKDLSQRDRSVVTVAALIAKNQAIDMPAYFDMALDDGVTAAELSEIITHLAFYSGWPNAMSAIAVTKDIFKRRGISADQLPPASPNLLPLNQASEKARAERVESSAGQVSPGLVLYTGDPLFQDLWLRPGLSPRDRSLVTVVTLIANGQTAQMAFHLGKAMDNGLTREQAGEVIAQLAFYAGWPSAFSAVPVAAEVFKSRGK